MLTGLVALLLLERAVSEWHAYTLKQGQNAASTPISFAGLYAVTLLAVAPSYVFWARQGVFVTNLMLPFVFLCLWQGVRWLRFGRPYSLILAALAGGLALYAKLSAYWIVVPFALLAGGWWFYLRLRVRRTSPGGAAVSVPPAPALTWQTAVLAAGAFCLPLLPLLAFNWQTGGTLASVTGNLGRSYYGVDNANVVANLPVRWSQWCRFCAATSSGTWVPSTPTGWRLGWRSLPSWPGCGATGAACCRPYCWSGRLLRPACLRSAICLLRIMFLCNPCW